MRVICFSWSNTLTDADAHRDILSLTLIRRMPWPQIVRNLLLLGQNVWMPVR
jgi:hypothetical protein